MLAREESKLAHTAAFPKSLQGCGLWAATILQQVVAMGLLAISPRQLKGEPTAAERTARNAHHPSLEMPTQLWWVRWMAMMGCLHVAMSTPRGSSSIKPLHFGASQGGFWASNLLDWAFHLPQMWFFFWNNPWFNCLAVPWYAHRRLISQLDANERSRHLSAYLMECQHWANRK